MGEDQFRVSTQATVTLNVTTPLTTYPIERRFNKAISVAELKGRLELLTGASPATMQLQLFSKDDSRTIVSNMEDDSALVGFYPVEDGMILHIIDEVTFAKAKSADVISNEPKFELTDEEYSKRNDTVKAYLVRNKLGKYAADGSTTINEKQYETDEDKEDAIFAASFTLGSRCQVTVQSQLAKRGEIKFIGKTHFKPGLWIGVAYDEPVGKNDGSIDGRKYFDCEPKYGAFVRPQFVIAGDFPEEEIDDLDEM